MEIPPVFPVEFHVEKESKFLSFGIGPRGFVKADNLSRFCLVNQRVGARVTAFRLILDGFNELLLLQFRLRPRNLSDDFRSERAASRIAADFLTPYFHVEI